MIAVAADGNELMVQRTCLCHCMVGFADEAF